MEGWPGWAGRSSRGSRAPAALIPAARRQAALRPWKKALEAAWLTAAASKGWSLWLALLAIASAAPAELWARVERWGGRLAGRRVVTRLR